MRRSGSPNTYLELYHAARNFSRPGDKNVRCSKYDYLKSTQYSKCVIYCLISESKISTIRFPVWLKHHLKKKQKTKHRTVWECKYTNIRKVKYILMVWWKEKQEMITRRANSAWVAQIVVDTQVCYIIGWRVS